MSDAVQFQKKLVEILSLCESNGNEIERESVEEFFKEENLSKEQMVLVYDYLLSQKVLVKGYTKVVNAEEIIDDSKRFSGEEMEFLRQYEEDIRMIPESDPMKHLLPEIVNIAKELYHPAIFLGDLIQEGSFGLVMGMNQGADEEKMLQMARESIQAIVESQAEVKLQDKKMADKVNELDDKIKELTKEMGRKITVNELAAFLEISEEEIEAIIRLAGEDLEETEEK